MRKSGIKIDWIARGGSALSPNPVTDHQVNSVSAREQLAQSIRDLTAALAERHASLTQALEVTRQKRGEALAAQVAERRSLMEHAGLVAFTQELLKETDQPCFVQAARQIHNRSLCFYLIFSCFSVFNLHQVLVRAWLGPDECSRI